MSNGRSWNSTLRPRSPKKERELAQGVKKPKAKLTFKPMSAEKKAAWKKKQVAKLLASKQARKASSLPAKGSSVLAQLDAELLELNNRLVRLLARNDAGYVQCYICHGWVPFEESVAMHFHARVGRGTRFDHRALKAGCNTCNSKPNGDRKRFAQRLAQQYGDHVPAELTRLSKEVQRYDRGWYREAIANSKARIADLTKRRSLPYL